MGGREGEGTGIAFVRRASAVCKVSCGRGGARGQLSTAWLEEFLEFRRRDGYQSRAFGLGNYAADQLPRRLGVGDLPRRQKRPLVAAVDVLVGPYRGSLACPVGRRGEGRARCFG